MAETVLNGETIRWDFFPLFIRCTLSWFYFCPWFNFNFTKVELSISLYSEYKCSWLVGSNQNIHTYIVSLNIKINKHWLHALGYANNLHRIGCLPYSHHVRATAKERPDGGIHYSDFWGYEIIMIELLAKKHNFKSVSILQHFNFTLKSSFFSP